MAQQGDSLVGVWEGGDPRGGQVPASIHEVVREHGHWLTRFRAVLPGRPTHLALQEDGTVLVGTRLGDVAVTPKGEITSLCPTGKLGVCGPGMEEEPDCRWWGSPLWRGTVEP